MTSPERRFPIDPPPGAPALTLRQRLALFQTPAMLGAAALFVCFIGIIAASDGLSLDSLMIWGFSLIPATAAGVAARDALEDSRRPAERRVLRLESLDSRQPPRKLRRFYARFESLEPFEVSFTQYAKLSEGERYLVIYSPHSAMLWAIEPAPFGGAP
ncbi:MAG TPA: hypothetical protein VGE07_17350 [Herpetosiphonaceae bacterium]